MGVREWARAMAPPPQCAICGDSDDRVNGRDGRVKRQRGQGKRFVVLWKRKVSLFVRPVDMVSMVIAGFVLNRWKRVKGLSLLVKLLVV